MKKFISSMLTLTLLSTFISPITTIVQAKTTEIKQNKADTQKYKEIDKFTSDNLSFKVYENDNGDSKVETYNKETKETTIVEVSILDGDKTITYTSRGNSKKIIVPNDTNIVKNIQQNQLETNHKSILANSKSSSILATIPIETGISNTSDGVKYVYPNSKYAHPDTNAYSQVSSKYSSGAVKGYDLTHFQIAADVVAKILVASTVSAEALVYAVISSIYSGPTVAVIMLIAQIGFAWSGINIERDLMDDRGCIWYFFSTDPYLVWQGSYDWRRSGYPCTYESYRKWGGLPAKIVQVSGVIPG
jgi:hypothetical protein